MVFWEKEDQAIEVSLSFIISSVAFSHHKTLIKLQWVGFGPCISALRTGVLDIEIDELFQGCLVLLIQT